MTCKKESAKIFRIHVHLKRGFKFHNFTNSCFWGLLVANFVTIYNWGSDQFAQCTSKNFMVIFVGGPPGLGPPATEHPNTPRLRHWKYTHTKSNYCKKLIIGAIVHEKRIFNNISIRVPHQ